MDLTKTLFANLYYYGTLGLRSWRLQQACAEGRAPIAILAFHRVADDRANAWTTPTAVFKAAIRWLADHVDLISLEDAQRRIQSGINRTPSVCITFDDGYAENFDATIP